MPEKHSTVQDPYAETSDNMGCRRYRDVQEALDECRREFNVRARCFARWVAEGRVARTDAQDRLDRLATACKLLEQLQTPSSSNP